MHMTAVGYISDTEQIVKACWSNFQHDCAAAFEWSETSPVPPALSAKNLPGGQTQLWNVHWIKRIDLHLAKSDKDCAPQTILDTENWLDWNGDWDNPNDGEDELEPDNESNLELGNTIENLEMPEEWDVSAAPNFPQLIWPTQRSKKKAAKVLITVNPMEMRRNQGKKKK